MKIDFARLKDNKNITIHQNATSSYSLQSLNIRKLIKFLFKACNFQERLKDNIFANFYLSRLKDNRNITKYQIRLKDNEIMPKIKFRLNIDIIDQTLITIASDKFNSPHYSNNSNITIQVYNNFKSLLTRKFMEKLYLRNYAILSLNIDQHINDLWEATFFIIENLLGIPTNTDSPGNLRSKVVDFMDMRGWVPKFVSITGGRGL